MCSHGWSAGLLIASLHFWFNKLLQAEGDPFPDNLNHQSFSGFVICFEHSHNETSIMVMGAHTTVLLDV
jgi:hypothetical protein